MKTPLHSLELALLGLLLLASSLLAGTAKMAWDPNPETDLAGYRIYWGPTPRGYTNFATFGKTTTNEVILNSGVYYFAVTAYATNGLESDYSNEITITVKPGAPMNLRQIFQGVMFEQQPNKTIPPKITPVAKVETIPGTSLTGTITGPWGTLNRTVVADTNGLASFPGKAITNKSYEVKLSLTRATIPLAVVESQKYP